MFDQVIYNVLWFLVLVHSYLYKQLKLPFSELLGQLVLSRTTKQKHRKVCVRSNPEFSVELYISIRTTSDYMYGSEE